MIYDLQAAHKLALSRGFLLTEDVNLIQKYVRLLRRDRVVSVADLGAGSGTTALAVFCARYNNIKVITFDISLENLEWTRRALSNNKCLDSWIGVNSPSWSYPFCVDMLLVDADHSYEGVKKDLDAWLPHMSPLTYVWAHDYSHYDYPGVKQAIDERSELVEIERAGWGWIGQLRLS